MPELPEVETTRRGILKPLLGRTITNVIVRQPNLRWPVPKSLKRHLCDQVIQNITRRGKYLLVHTNNGVLLIHLGMSGYLLIVPAEQKPKRHDHVDIIFDNQLCLRFNDTRRFGSILWTADDPSHHPRLINLGPEPLSNAFNGEYCYQQSRHRKIKIKQFLMDSHFVVGVGNIYANESLFLAKISPLRPAGKISLSRYQDLSQAVKKILQQAIKAGGTTLRDFQNSDGKPGYFKQQLNVYGRQGLPCVDCGKPLKSIQLNQRATVYCGYCQT